MYLQVYARWCLVFVVFFATLARTVSESLTVHSRGQSDGLAMNEPGSVNVHVRQARKGWLVPSPVLGLADEVIWNILSFASDSNHLLTSDFIPPEHFQTDRGRRNQSVCPTGLAGEVCSNRPTNWSIML